MEKRWIMKRGTVAGIWLSESVFGHLKFLDIYRERQRERTIEREKQRRERNNRPSGQRRRMGVR